MSWFKRWWPGREAPPNGVEMAAPQSLAFSQTSDPTSFAPAAGTGSIPLEVVHAIENRGYQRGYLTGLDQGELQGRYLLLREIEIRLAGRGQALEEFDYADFVHFTTRQVH